MKNLLSNIRLPLYILSGMNILAGSLLMVTQYLPDLGGHRVETIFTGAFIIVSVLIIILAARGQTQVAALIFIISLTVIATGIGFLYSGLQNPAVIAMYFILMPFAGLYLERRYHYLVVGGIALLVLWMYLGGIQGSGGLDAIGIDELVVSLAALLVGGATLEFTSNRFRTSLAEAEANRSQLAEQNQELIAVRTELEDRVAERTRDLDRRNRYLVAISEIVHETSTLLEEASILQRSVDLIAQRFEFYHVGLFLLDAKNEYAVLRAASSEGGRAMIERGHRLLVGKQGIVGYVTGIGLPRISQDIAIDRIHTVSVELPDTRSEMALPLKARGEIIGALDIQDTVENAFSQQDVTILQTLADQLALAISNARLYDQSRESVEEAQRAYGELNRRGWLESQRQGRLPSYRYLAGSRRRAERIETGSLPFVESPARIELPIQVRGQTIGTIEIGRGEEEIWSGEEQAVLEAIAEQMGIALDGARLYDATQQRAANERMISALTTEIRESLDMEVILRTAAARLREELDLPEVTIRLAEQTPTNGSGRKPRKPEPKA